MGRLQKVAAAVLVLGLSAGLAACGDDDDDGDEATTETTAASSEDAAGGTREAGDSGDGTLTIEEFTFPALTVAPGAAVAVANADDVPHTVTADDGEFDVRVDGGGDGTFTAPDEPGTYAYHCEVHSSMKGELVVE